MQRLENILPARALLRFTADEFKARSRDLLRSLAETIKVVPQRSRTLRWITPHLGKLTEVSRRKRFGRLSGNV